MRTLDVQLPNDSKRTIAPVPRSRLGHFSKLLIELQSIWVEEEFSTGDAIARDDVCNLMKEIWALLPCASDRGATYSADDIDTLLDNGDYEQLGALFFGNSNSAYTKSTGTFDLQAFQGAELWKLHEVQPRKKLQMADELRRANLRLSTPPQESPETLPPTTFPLKPAVTQKRTRSQTSSTASEKSD